MVQNFCLHTVYSRMLGVCEIVGCDDVARVLLILDQFTFSHGSNRNEQLRS